MDRLIKALQIFAKYLDRDSFYSQYPTNCQHDHLYVSVDRSVSKEDSDTLHSLGFDVSEYDDGNFTSFCSLVYGSN